MAAGNKCPQCGTPCAKGQSYCGHCGAALSFCGTCGYANLHDKPFCHACGSQLEVKETKHQIEPLAQPGTASIERMRICPSCKKAIGSRESFCSYCGNKMKIVPEESQTLIDRRTTKVMDLMVEKVIEAKNHPEYREIDERGFEIANIALRSEQPRDAEELSFTDQLRLLALVFEYTRDRVPYRGETFGEYVRWPWETLRRGGDCDCKGVLLASLLNCLNYRRMYFLVLPGGTYSDSKEGQDKRIEGHALLEVELLDGEKQIPVRLDPSCEDCDVDEISESIEPFLSNFYRIPIMP